MFAINALDPTKVRRLSELRANQRRQAYVLYQFLPREFVELILFEFNPFDCFPIPDKERDFVAYGIMENTLIPVMSGRPPNPIKCLAIEYRPFVSESYSLFSGRIKHHFNNPSFIDRLQKLEPRTMCIWYMDTNDTKILSNSLHMECDFSPSSITVPVNIFG